MAVKPTQEPGYGQAVFDPGHRSKLAYQAAEAMAKGLDRAVRLGLSVEFDEYFLPLKPGDLCSVQAMTGHGKSSILQCVANNVAKRITESNRDECVLVVSWEQTVEEAGLVDIGKRSGYSTSEFARGQVTDWERVFAAAVEVATVPIWYIGNSAENRRTLPPLTLPFVCEAMTWLERESKITPALVILDHLQQIRATVEREQRRLEIADNVHRAKELALALGCPVMLAVQAKQEVGERNIKLPGIYDGQETSVTAQVSDRVLGAWRPWKTEELKESFKLCGRHYTVESDLLLIGVTKQRYGPDGHVFAFHEEPGKNIIGPREDRYGEG